MPEQASNQAAWYYARDRRRVGPVSLQQLRELAAAGELWPEDMLLPEGARQWIAADSVPGLFSASMDIPPPMTMEVARQAGRETVTAAKVGETRPAVDAAHAPTDAYPPQAEADITPDVPGYEILGTLGRGGMGIVYKARQLSLKRVVALKMIRAGADAGPEERVRFRSEAEAVARLQHPNIVQVHEVGEWRAAGTGAPIPYFSLEFVDGGSMQTQLGGTPLPARQAAELVQTLARAIHFAHQHGIIHRDLKPANVLLQKSESQHPKSDKDVSLPASDSGFRISDFVPKITDFGLAKQLDDDSAQTRSGTILGTPSYMAPEQAEGRSRDIGPVADVYALGAILYETLTGRPPFRAATFLDTVEQVRHQEPVPPSRLQSKMPRDVETICLKCLNKDGRKRYASAQDLADDLRRFLAGEPIHGRRTPLWERGLKWVRRRPAWAALLAVTALALVVLGCVIAFFIDRLRAEVLNANKSEQTALAEKADADRARAQETASLVRLYVGTGVRGLNDGDWYAGLPWLVAALNKDRSDEPGPEQARREDMHRTRIGATLRYGPRLTRVWFHNDEVRQALFSPDGRQVLTLTTRDARLWDVARDRLARALTVDGLVRHISYSPDGSRIVLVGEDAKHVKGRAWVHDAAGKLLVPPIELDHPAIWAGLSRDNSLLLTLNADQVLERDPANWAARVWDAATGQPRSPPLRHGAEIKQASFSPDGQRVLTAGMDGTARVWDARTGKPLLTISSPGDHFLQASFSPDGSRIVTAGTLFSARVWNATTGQPLTPLLRHSSNVDQAIFSPDGRFVATSADSPGEGLAQVGEVHVWFADSGEPLHTPWRQSSRISRIVFSLDSRFLAVVTEDGRARVWDLDDESPLTPPLGHDRGIADAMFSSDSRFLVTAGRDGTARVWDLAGTRPATHTLRLDYISYKPKFGHRGGALITFGETDARESAIQVWDTAKHQCLSPSWKPGGEIAQVIVSADDRRVVTVTTRAVVQVWETTGRAVGPPLNWRQGSEQPVSGELLHVAVNPDGSRVAVAPSAAETILALDAATSQPVWPRLDLGGKVLHAAFSPDGAKLVTVSSPSLVRVWDAATGRAITPPFAKVGKITNAAFSPDSRLLVTYGFEGVVQVWDATSGQTVSEPVRLNGMFDLAVDFSPDSSRFVTRSSRDRFSSEARVWDVATSKPLTPPLRHAGSMRMALFSPDSRRLVTADVDGTARVWDATTGEPVTPPLRHFRTLHDLAFSADGRRLIMVTDTLGEELALWTWDLSRCELSVPNLELLSWLLRGQAVDPSASLVSCTSEQVRDAWRTLGQNDAACMESPRADVASWRRRAVAWNERHKSWPQALAHLDALTALEPTEGDHYVRRAWIRRRLRQWSASAADCDQAIKYGVDHWQVWTARGDARANTGDWAGALADFTRALQRRPREAALWHARGTAHASLGHWAQARSDQTRAVELSTAPAQSPTRANAWYALTLLSLALEDEKAYRKACADLLARFGDTDQAQEIRTVTAACRVLPDALPNMEPVVRLARKLAAKEPKKYDNLLSLGAALCRARQYDEAIKQLDGAVKLASAEGLPWDGFFLAISHHHLGHTELARAAFKRAVTKMDRMMADKQGDLRSGLGWYNRLELRLLRAEAEKLVSENPNPKSELRNPTSRIALNFGFRI
jgi:WD40 repeat protein/serine/threonine protein kinase/tetratricopeptide (TPR) repeat protein